ncbi:FtsB family cell division protein [Arthrobacter sp. A5]|uniref:FtsB family cell division protein n=1 Tax=Arthrobacter sp. A5 TaxID=576926 RepID=UPI003DA83AC8
MATRRPKVPRAQAPAGARGGSAGDGRPGELPNGTPRAASSDSSPASGSSAGGASVIGSSVAASPTPSGKKSWGRKPWGRNRGPGRSSDSKPAVAKRAGSAAGAAPRPVPARAFSGRLLALAVVLLTITVLLAPSVHTYLQQRAQITALSQDIAAKTQQQSDLKSELSRWSDPAYIKQQARDRVNMVMPGETGYWVYGADGISAQPEKSMDSKSQAAPNGNLPWVDGLWESIKRSAIG